MRPTGRRPRQSYGQPQLGPNIARGSLPGARVPVRRVDWSAPAGALNSTIGRLGSRGVPGRSAVASASALGAEGRRFESCRPDSADAAVTGSLHQAAIRGCSSMAEPQPSKLVMRVRFSSPALSGVPSQGSFRHAGMRLHKRAQGSGHTWAISFWAADRPSELQLSAVCVEVGSVWMDPFGRSLLLTRVSDH
jgi:hypothetical protein